MSNELIPKECLDFATSVEALNGIEFEINSEEEKNEVIDILHTYNDKLKQLKELRFSVTRPMDIAKKRVMDFFAPPQGILERAIAVGKRAVSDYNNAQEALAREKLEAQRAARAKELEEQAQALLEQGKVDEVVELALNEENAAAVSEKMFLRKQPNAGASISYKYKAVIEDMAQVPEEHIKACIDSREFATVVEDYFTYMANKAKSAITVPGIRFEKREIVTLRKRKL